MKKALFVALFFSTLGYAAGEDSIKIERLLTGNHAIVSWKQASSLQKGSLIKVQLPNGKRCTLKVFLVKGTLANVDASTCGSSQLTVGEKLKATSPEQPMMDQMENVEPEQEREKQASAWSVGIDLGIDSSSASISGAVPNVSYTSVRSTGFIGGAHLDYSFAPNWALESGLRLDQRSFNGTVAAINSTTSNPTEAQSIWIEVPLLLKYKFFTDRWTPYLYAGPEYGFLSKETDTNLSTTGNSLTSSELSFDLGVGVAFSIADATAITVAGGYVMGLSNLVNTSGPLNGMNVKLNSFVLTAGIDFSL